MKMEDHLSSDTKKSMYQKSNQNKSSKPKKKEKLSKRDLVDLMGMNKDRYGRGRGGAIRRK